MGRLQIFVQLDLHVVELYLHAVEQGVVIGGAGGDLIQRIDHLDDAVQNTLGHHQTQVAGSGGQRGGDEALLHPLGRGALATDQVTEPLDDDAAAQHIGQPCDAFTVAVGVLEGLGEMLGHQQGEVGVLRMEGGVLVAVTIDGDDTVGVLIDHHTLGIHAEGAYPILKLLCPIDDLALIQLVGEVGEHLIGQLHPHADIHTVGAGGDLQRRADLLHPLAAAAAHGDDTGAALIALLVGGDGVAVRQLLHGADGGIEENIHPVLQTGIEVLQHHIVDVRSQMPHGGVQQVQVVLQTQLLDAGVAGGVELGALPAVFHVDLIHILHQLQRLLFADVLVEGAAELIGDVILSVGEGAGAAEAVHNGAGGAVNAAFDLHTVNGTAAALQRVAGFKQRQLQVRTLVQQLPGRIDAAGAAADDKNVICHKRFLLF